VDEPVISLLLVDDEDDFRQPAAAALGRRGFAVAEARSGQEAVDAIAARRPEVVVLDLKMAGMSGLETLQRIRAIDPQLPVIILTGYGTFHDALAGIKLEIVDFLQKPVDIELLAEHIRRLRAAAPATEPVREPTIAELMVPAESYPKLYVDQTAEEALATLAASLVARPPQDGAHEIRSALVFDREEKFLGTVRFADLMKLVLPRFLTEAPYPTFYPGMFVAQCKVMGKRSFTDLMGKSVTIDARAPLLAAVHLMVRHRMSALPVTDGDRLVGVLRDRAVILEIARHMPSLG
jgi:ActR/RegA family two-component response regulator